MLKTPPLTQTQVNEIRLKYLTDPQATIASLSAELDVPTYFLSKYLKGKDFEAFKTSFQETMATLAKDKLLAASELAAQKWVESLGPASLKGDHKPMRDLLAANRVIDLTPKAQSPVVVQIGIALSDLRLAPTPTVSIEAIGSVSEAIASIPSESEVPAETQNDQAEPADPPSAPAPEN